MTTLFVQGASHRELWLALGAPTQARMPSEAIGHLLHRPTYHSMIRLVTSLLCSSGFRVSGVFSPLNLGSEDTGPGGKRGFKDPRPLAQRNSRVFSRKDVSGLRVLGGSGVVISGVVSKVTIVITPIRGL